MHAGQPRRDNGQGTLRLKGAGTFTFSATTLTNKLELAGTEINLGKPANIDTVKFTACGTYAAGTMFWVDDTGLLAVRRALTIIVR